MLILANTFVNPVISAKAAIPAKAGIHGRGTWFLPAQEWHPDSKNYLTTFAHNPHEILDLAQKMG